MNFPLRVLLLIFGISLIGISHFSPKIVYAAIFEEVSTKNQFALYGTLHKDYDENDDLKSDMIEQVKKVRSVLQKAKDSVFILNESMRQLLSDEQKKNLKPRIALTDAVLDLIEMGFQLNVFSDKMTVKQIDHRYYKHFIKWLIFYLDKRSNFEDNKITFESIINTLYQDAYILPGVSLDELKNPRVSTLFKAIDFSFKGFSLYEGALKKHFNFSWCFSNSPFPLSYTFKQFIEAFKHELLEAVSASEETLLLSLDPKIQLKVHEIIEKNWYPLESYGDFLFEHTLLHEMATTSQKKNAVFAGVSHIQRILQVLEGDDQWKKIKEYDAMQEGKKIANALDINWLSVDREVVQPVDSSAFNFFVK